MTDVLCVFGTDEFWPSWTVFAMWNRDKDSTFWRARSAMVPKKLLDEWLKREEDYESLQREIDAYWKQHGTGQRMVGEL